MGEKKCSKRCVRASYLRYFNICEKLLSYARLKQEEIVYLFTYYYSAEEIYKKKGTDVDGKLSYFLKIDDPYNRY
jgi:hypothetical protein